MISTDRGSEFFVNDRKSATRENDSYAQHAIAAFGKMCEDLDLGHLAQPVGVHEVVAESYFARHADAVDAMLQSARLSGVFAAYAWQYSAYVENQMPCLARKDRWMSPAQIVTSVPPDWGKIIRFLDVMLMS